MKNDKNNKKEKKKGSFFSDFSDFLFLIKPQFKYGFGYNLARVIIKVIAEVSQSLISVYFYMTIINMLMDGTPLPLILVTAFLFIIASFASNVMMMEPLKYFAPEWGAKNGKKIEEEIIKQAVKCNSKNFDDPVFFKNYNLAIRDYDPQSWQAVNLIGTAISNFISIFALISVLISISVSPWLILLSVVAFILNLTVGKRVGDFTAARWREINESNRKIFYIRRIISQKDYAADLRTTRLSDMIIKLNSDVCDEVCDIRRKHKVKFIFARLYSMLFDVAVGYGAVFYAIYAIYKKIISVGEFAATIQASQRIYYALSSIAKIRNDMHLMAEYSRSIQEFFNAPSDIEDSTEERSKDKTFAPVPADPFALTLNNVCFSYNNTPNGKFSINNINMNIKSGQKVALVGENGAGKSTLIKLLLRLYDTTDGEILINGKSIKDYDVKKLRNSIGTAFQTTQLYAFSMAENMNLYHTDDKETLEGVVKKLGMESIFEKNNCDFDTVLTKEFDEKGIVLSGGECQKLGLSRVLHGKFGMMILDEPSAALDPVSEYKLAQTILSLNDVTIVMISHRLSAIRNFDCIYVMDGGQIVESGNHDELMKKDGKYAEMFRLQSEQYIAGSDTETKQ